MKIDLLGAPPLAAEIDQMKEELEAPIKNGRRYRRACYMAAAFSLLTGFWLGDPAVYAFLAWLTAAFVFEFALVLAGEDQAYNLELEPPESALKLVEWKNAYPTVGAYLHQVGLQGRQITRKEFAVIEAFVHESQVGSACRAVYGDQGAASV